MSGSSPPSRTAASAAASVTPVSITPSPTLLKSVTKCRSLQQRKRKRLNAVLDKITHHISSNGNSNSNLNNTSSSAAATSVANNHGNNNDSSDNEVDNLRVKANMFGRTEQHLSQMTSKSAATAGSETANLHEDVEDQSTASRKTTGPTMMSDAGRKLSSAALRRELWRDNQQQSIEDQPAGSFARTTTYGEVSHVVQQQQPRNVGTTGPGDHVFKFDSFDRDRYLSGSSSTTSRCESSEASTMVAGTPSTSSNVLMVHNDDQPTSEDIFSPASGRSPHSSMSSPHVSVDSPRICFSPLRIKDSIEEEDHHNHHHHHHLPKLSVRGCESPLPPAAHHGGGLIPAASTSTSNCWLEPNHAKYMPGGLSRPISPNPSITPTTPISPSTTPLHALRHIPAYLTEVYRRRCLSDTDLSASWDDLKGAATNRSGQQQQGQQQHLHGQYSLQQNYQKTLMQLPGSRHLPLLSQKGGSLESEASSTTTQESPLDLSVRSSVSSTTGIMALKRPLAASMDSIQTSTASTRGPLLAGKGRSRSSTSRSSGGERDRYPDRFSLDRLDVVEVAGSGGASNSNSDVAYVCPICGQMFSLHDRLAKHMASRHKSRSTDSGSKAYLCDVCRRSFARSDMLTRHMRLHTGIKPYTCRVCGQVFSRSDHLSTHQRTHTGEKPYRCPTCPYAACRRDMITRHMRTHARYELQESTSIEETSVDGGGGAESPHPGSLSSGAGPSRSISSESADPPMPTHPPPPLPPLLRQQPLTKPPSPMDTEEESGLAGFQSGFPSGRDKSMERPPDNKTNS